MEDEINGYRYVYTEKHRQDGRGLQFIWTKVERPRRKEDSLFRHPMI